MVTLGENGEALGKYVGEILVDTYKQTLIENRKVATAKTIRSIEYEIEITNKSISIRILANKSLFYIETDKKANTKLPVKKVNGKFELVDELQDWVEAVGYTGNYYVLARAIARKFRKGIPITEIVLQKITSEIESAIVDFLGESVQLQFINEIRNLYEGLQK